MLGDILNRLSHPVTAEATLAMVSGREMRERVAAAAEAESVSVGMVVANRVRHLLDHGTDETWLDLLGAIATAPEPGAAAIDRVLALVFPTKTRIRVTHAGQ